MSDEREPRHEDLPPPLAWGMLLDADGRRTVGGRLWRSVDERRAITRFERAATAGGWERAEVVDQADITAAVRIELPPVAWHRPVDGGDAWMTTEIVESNFSSASLCTTAVVQFPEARLPRIDAVSGLLDPTGDLDPHLFGPARRRWRVYTPHRDWAIYVGDHLVAHRGWHTGGIRVAGTVVASRLRGTFSYRPEAGDLTIALATVLHSAHLEHGRPRLPIKRPPWMPEPTDDPSARPATDP